MGCPVYQASVVLCLGIIAGQSPFLLVANVYDRLCSATCLSFLSGRPYHPAEHRHRPSRVGLCLLCLPVSGQGDGGVTGSRFRHPAGYPPPGRSLAVLGRDVGDGLVVA